MAENKKTLKTCSRGHKFQKSTKLPVCPKCWPGYYKKNLPSKEVDAYIKKAPKEIQPKLIQLRKIIRSSAPKAEEKTSYGMPGYKYNGPVVWFAHFKKHIGVFVPPPIVQDFKEELKNYKTSKGTVQFPLDKSLPVSLIKKLIKARLKYNQEK